MGTLVIAAISAVVAATVVSELWQTGTVMATAMTPVLVALVKEALERPAQRVTAIAVRPPRAPGEAPGEAPPPPPVVVTDEDGLTPMRVYRPGRKVRRRWKLAIATGLLAFAIAVAAMTLPELVAGRSVVSARHDTTIFGGRRHTAATTTRHTDQKKTTSTDETVTTDKQRPQDTTSTPQPTTTTPVQPAQPAPQTQSAPAPQTQTQPPPTATQPPAAAPQQQPAPTAP